ncbi:MAG: hypothetical protein KGO94_10500 [Alphaproteobacteria bacterium]|nr:hypothetical protein [Alphaproteobacteria bacterium]
MAHGCCQLGITFFTKEWLRHFDGPFHLRFFNGGWLEETHLGAPEVCRRIDQLVCKSDVRLSARVFTRDFDSSSAKITASLNDMLNSGESDRETAVICDVDIDKQSVVIESIGSGSLLANIWGKATTTYPCQTGHSYDKVVSRAYFKALQTNRPVYDQVMAAMVKPTGAIHWIGYQRVIFPRKHVHNEKPRVMVNCELAAVDIQLF